MAVPWPESSKGESGGRSEPASTVLPRRVAHGAHDLQGKLGASKEPERGNSGSGKPGQAFVIGKRQGTLDLARGTESRGGRGGDLVDVPVRCLSHCRIRQAALAQRSPFPIRILSKEGWGTRWTGAWPTDDNRSKSRPLFKAARAF